MGTRDTDTQLTQPKPGADYLRLVGLIVAVAVLLGAVGIVPTRRIAGDNGIPAMIAGIVGSVLAGSIGLIPAVFARQKAPADRQVAMLGATSLRMLVTLALVCVLVFGGWFERKTLVTWSAISYVVLLVVETMCVVQMMRRRESIGT